MILRTFENKEEWNSIVLSQPQSQLLLSWEWGNFQKTQGKEIKRYGLFSASNNIIAIFYTIKYKMPFGFSYIYSPRSPLVVLNNQFDNQEFIDTIKKLCKESNAMFWKCDLLESSLASMKSLQKVEDLQPSKTLMLDLNHSEENLLKTIHHKTRYNIRIAQRDGVIIREASKKDYSRFLELLDVTAQRDGFSTHTKSYYLNLLNMDKTFTKLMVGEYKGEVICANLMIYFGDTVTYLHGASSNQNRNVMAPFLLQWECIIDAKMRGFRYYDFWGINEIKWPGVTRFKRNFVNENNGLEVSYIGTYDFVYKKISYIIYQIYKIAKKLV